jgi:hypothetical protein
MNAARTKIKLPLDELAGLDTMPHRLVRAKNQFSSTRAALSMDGRAKSTFLSANLHSVDCGRERNLENNKPGPPRAEKG